MNFATDSSWGWGYEIGYFNLAKAEAKSELGSFYTNLKLKQKGIDFLATFNKQFNEKVGAFAKAGLAVVSQDLDKESNVEANWSTDGSGVLPEIAGGVLVNLTDNLALTGTVNHLFGKSVNIHSNTDDIASSTSGMLGLRYNIT